MENRNDTYQQVRRSRILVLVFLIIMILAMISSLYFYRELTKSKRKLQKANRELQASNAALSHARDSVANLSDSLAVQKQALLVALDSIQTLSTGNEKVIEVIDNAQRVAKSSKYEAATALERAAFKKILENDFEEAIALLKKANEIYPKFHNVYGIYTYLSRNRNLFNDPRGQRAIKRKIINEYRWKAPEDLLRQLRAEVQ